MNALLYWIFNLTLFILLIFPFTMIISDTKIISENFVRVSYYERLNTDNCDTKKNNLPVCTQDDSEWLVKTFEGDKFILKDSEAPYPYDPYKKTVYEDTYTVRFFEDLVLGKKERVSYNKY